MSNLVKIKGTKNRNYWNIFFKLGLQKGYNKSTIIIVVGNMTKGGGELKNRIRVFRAEHNLSQSELAEKAGVTRQTISNIEIEAKEPTLATAVKISTALGATLEEVFPGIKDLINK